MVFRMTFRSNPAALKAPPAPWRHRRPWRWSLGSGVAGARSGPGPSEEPAEPSPERAPRSGPPQKPPHVPVMVKEILHYLDIHPGKVILDMTFGGGGHTRAVLDAGPEVTVLALDRDPAAFALAQQMAEEHRGRLRPILGRFSELEVLLSDMKLEPGAVDAVLLDAGCSSMQLDQPERGFSLSRDGPLDMRMDGGRYPDMASAADVVNTLDLPALTSILRAYGEEPHARKVAAAIVAARRVRPIGSTQELAGVVAASFPAAAVHARRDRLHRPAHVATKTFQALRVFVNDELNELHSGLRAARNLLRPGGRLCVLTFHSLEDRLVKRFLRGDDLSKLELDHFGPKKKRAGTEKVEDGRREGTRGGGGVHWLPLSRKVITPEKEDVEDNPRGRSAKLRVAVRR